MLPHLLTLALALAPSLASAALYPKDSMVKMIDTRGFRNALKENRTSVVAFVASWCGHCKAMAPQYSKAALGLHPLIPLYAVDCDENRSLCAEQGVNGFPTIKLFPRGREHAPILFEHSDRTASAFFYFATRRVPHKNKKLNAIEEIEPWTSERIDQTRVLLLSKAKDMPLMWKVLANKYRDVFVFANHRDSDGKSFAALGYKAGIRKESKLLVYPAGSTKPFLFEGVLKYHSISKFFDSILDGSANLTATNSQVPEGGFKSTSEGEEIERRQKLIKEHNVDFHASGGSTARPGDSPESNQMEEEDTHERLENPIHRAIRIQLEKEAQAAKDAARDSMLKAGDTDQDILELRTDTESAHLFTTMDINVQPSASESCIPSGTADSMAQSCATPISETEVPSAREGTLDPELGHVKDEL